MTKFCKDCKHYFKYEGRASIAEWNKHICKRNAVPTVNLITGEPEPDTGNLLCEQERYDKEDETKCGPDAKFFEAADEERT